MKFGNIFAVIALVTAFYSSALASTIRVLDGQEITNGAALLTLPTSTDTLTGRATTDTLTNKTISGASNTFSNIPTSAIAGSALSGTNSGDVTLGTANGLSLTGQVLSLGTASGSTTGALTSSDWTVFNGKLSSSLTSAHLFIGNGSNVATDTAVSGDIGITNAGVVTIASGSVTAAKMSSGAALSGTVATANGSGGVSYLAVPSMAPSLNGGSGAAQSITAAGGISLSSISYANQVWVVGNATAITVTATPSITACTADGQKLNVIGTDNTKTVTLQDQSNLASSGLSLNGNWVGAKDSVLNLHCDITQGLWVEDSRR